MVAAIAAGNTSHWRVTQWVYGQGRFNDVYEQAVLAYLAAHAFYREPNPEGGEVGQVLYQASYFESIMTGTGIKSRKAVRSALNRLQDKAYIQRETRGPIGANEPHRIYVLWAEDALREEMRDGRKRLPPPLLDRPQASPRQPAPKPQLRVLQGGELLDRRVPREP